MAANEAEEIRQLRAALRDTQQALAREIQERQQAEESLERAQRSLERTRDQLTRLRHSPSWIATAPLRAWHRRVRG